jgi:hypothetical protein
MAAAPKTLTNIGHSFYRFFRTHTYDGSVPGGTLLQQFPQLTILPAYPSDLAVLRTPTLAIGMPSGMNTDALYFAELGQDQVISMALYGFVKGQGSDHLNALYHSRLMNDVFWLCDSVARHDGLALWDQASNSQIGQVEVNEALCRHVPETMPAVEIDRFKFVVELEIGYTAEAVV